MNTRFRIHTVLAAAAGALLLSAGVHAAPLSDLVREAQADSDRPPPPPHRERQSAPRQSAPAQPAPAQSAPAPSAGRGNFRSERSDRGSMGTVVERNFDRRGPSSSGTVVQRRGDRGDRGDRGTIGTVIERNFDRGNGGSYQGNRRPPRYVSNLPGGYRQYNWNGRPYYNYGGHWYRPYGNRYVVVGAPYGLFVDFLPGYYSSFWFGNTRYFYADDTYYTYEPARRGYVVTRSPYGDDQDEEYSEARDEDMFVYPAKGQSEQQQADDRYECHRWAADQAHYDPVDSNYDADKRADYLRAMTACLTGRGYSVK